MASAAAKAVWGENKQHGDEPVSGQTGNTAKGEPYDAGNLDEPNSTMNTPAGAGESTKPAEFAKKTGTAAEAEDTPGNPSTEMKMKDAPKDSSKGQIDVRNPENPNTNPKSAPTDVNNTEDGPAEAQKLEGSGPKPVDEVAREHGGDAGAVNKSTSGGDKPAAGAGEEDEDGPNAKSTGEGTGEQYVKTSGLNADGGDFDATKPGAGREAERLMVEKGMHPGGADAKGKSDDSVESKGHESKDHESKESDSHEKKSFGQKIKDKLHKN